MKKHIPNAITCGNLLCGCFAIVAVFNDQLQWGAYFIGIAAVLDFCDGFFARLFKVNGELGKQLDSLADMVSFGLVPSLIMFQLIKRALLFHHLILFSRDNNEVGELNVYNIIPFFAFLIAIFSAIRLAKFNIDIRQTNSFIGLPTPANAIFIGSLPLLEHFQNTSLFVNVSSLLENYYFLIIMTILLSFFLVAEIPLFALKFKNFSLKGNKLRFLFLGLSFIILLIFQFLGLPICILLYILLSILNSLVFKYYQKQLF